MDLPVLVVKDTNYHTSVPLLVGTNFLHAVQIEEPQVPKCLQVALNAVQLIDCHLEKSDGVYGIVYVHVPSQCRLGPGEVETICGKVRVSAPVPE